MGGGPPIVWFVPAAATGLLILLTLLVILWRRWRARRRYPHPTCPTCRYVTIGLTWTACPECGTDLESTGVIPAGTPKPWPVGVRAAVWIVLVFGAWRFVLLPLIGLLPPGREIRDRYEFQAPVSAAYESIGMTASTSTWPHTRPEPDGEWAIVLRARDDAAHRWRVRSNSDEDDPAVIANWIASSIGMDEPSEQIRAEAEAIAERLDAPGADRRSIDFGTGNFSWTGLPGPDRPFTGIFRRYSVHPVPPEWPSHAATIAVVLVAVGGFVVMARRQRRLHRERAETWRATRADGMTTMPDGRGAESNRATDSG